MAGGAQPEIPHLLPLRYKWKYVGPCGREGYRRNPERMNSLRNR